MEEGEKLRMLENHLEGSALEWWQIVKLGTEEYKGFRQKFMENYCGNQTEKWKIQCNKEFFQNGHFL